MTSSMTHAPHRDSDLPVAFVALGPLTLTTRDTAALTWLGVAVAAVLFMPTVRRSLGAVARSLVPFLVPLVLYAGWISLVTYLAYRFGAWEWSLLKDSLIWFVVSGAALLFRFTRPATEKHFFLRTALDALRVSAFLGFYLNLVTFDLWLEVVLLPAFVFLGLLAVVAGMKEHTKPVETFANVLVLVMLAGVAVAVGAQLAGDWRGRDIVEEVRSLLLPLGLTVAALPFIAWFSLYASYQTALVHMRGRNGHAAPWKAKLALVSSFHVNNRELHRFAGFWPRRLAEAGGFRAGRRVIAEFRADLARSIAADRKKADDLRRYTGVVGADEEERQLDRREFAETINALEWLAACQSGWYQNRSNGRYPKDLLERLGEMVARGLPPDHGMKLKVRKDGQAWFAWRRTITGWCFAIGGKGPPPNQWFYDGPDPPSGYPGSARGWGDRPFERGPNWDDASP